MITISLMRAIGTTIATEVMNLTPAPYHKSYKAYNKYIIYNGNKGYNGHGLHYNHKLYNGYNSVKKLLTIQGLPRLTYLHLEGHKFAHLYYDG